MSVFSPSFTIVLRGTRVLLYLFRVLPAGPLRQFSDFDLEVRQTSDSVPNYFFERRPFVLSTLPLLNGLFFEVFLSLYCSRTISPLCPPFLPAYCKFFYFRAFSFPPPNFFIVPTIISPVILITPIPMTFLHPQIARIDFCDRLPPPFSFHPLTNGSPKFPPLRRPTFQEIPHFLDVYSLFFSAEVER